MKSNAILKRIFSYFSLSILSSVVGVITIPYLTRVLNPEEYAYEGIMYSIIYILVPLLSLSANGLVAINKVNMTKEQYDKFKSNYISLGIILFTVIEILAIIMSLFFKSYSLIIIVAPIISICSFLSDINATELIQENRAKIYGILNIMINLLKLITSIIFISLINLSWHGRIMSLLFSELVFAAVRMVYFADKSYKFEFGINKNYLKEFFVYGLPILVSVGASWIINESGRFITLNYFTLKEVGYYSVATRIGALIVILNNSLVNAMCPIIYLHLKENTIKSRIKKYTLFYFLFLALSIILIFAVIFLAGDMILGAKYRDGKMIICIILVAFMFSGIYRISGLVLDYYKKNIIKTVLIYLSAAAYVGVAFGGIKSIGANAAGIAMVVSYIVLFIGSYCYAGKIIKNKE